MLAAIWVAALVCTSVSIVGSVLGATIGITAAVIGQCHTFPTWRLVGLGVALLSLSAGLQIWIFERTWTDYADEQVQVWAVAAADSRELVGQRGPPIYLTTVRITARGNAQQPQELRSRAVIFGSHAHLAGQELRIIGRVTEVDGTRGLAVVIRERSTVVEGQPGGIWALPTQLRAGLRQEVASRGTAGAGLFMAVTLGDEAELDPELAQAMRVVSLTHITAVSGAHFAIILGAAVAIISWLPGGSWRVGLLLIGLPVVLIPLVHPSPSVLRASITAAVTGLAILLGRRSQALTALLATALILLCADPWLSTNFGFILSVVATGGIVVLCDPVASALENFMPPSLAKTIAVPFCAQVACAPVLVFLAPQLSPYSVVANVITAAALVPITLCGLLACVVLPLLPWLGSLLVTVGSWCSEAVVWAASWTAGLPGAALPWPEGIIGVIMAAGVSVGLVSGLLLLSLTRGRENRPEHKNMAGS